MKNDIDPSLFRELARAKNHMAILDDGTSIPLLQIKLCGCTVLFYRGTKESVQLTPHMETLITELCSTPDLAMPVNKLVARIWPEAQFEKGRNNLDRLLSRIRSNLRSSLGLNADKQHLILRKGVLSLENCEVDIVNAVHYAQKGLTLASQVKYWQAHSAFEVMEHHLGQISATPSTIQQKIIDASSCWCEIMLQGHMYERALSVIQAALSFDPIDDRLQKLQYELFNILNLPAKAYQARQKYITGLKDNGFSENEVSEVIRTW